MPQSNAKLGRLLSLWVRQRGRNSLPSASQFTPKMMTLWQGHIGLVDVVHSPLRFRVAKAGGILTTYAGRDYTGKWIDNCVEPEDLDSALKPYLECVGTREPIFSNTVYAHPGAQRSLMQRLYLPCSSDGIVIDTIMVAVYALTDPITYY